MLLYFGFLMIIIKHSLQLTRWFCTKTNRGEPWMVDENKYSAYSAVVKEVLRRKKKRTRQREQCQGAIYSPCAHVSTQCCVCYTWSSHLLECCGLTCGWMVFLCCQKSTHATWQMFTVANPNTLHLILFLSSVHVQQQQGGRTAGGFVEWMIDPGG